VIARVALGIMAALCAAAQAHAVGLTIAITVTDSAERPVPGIRIELRSAPGGAALETAIAGANGQASFDNLEPRPYEISIAGEAFERVRREVDLRTGASATVEVTLVPALARKESVEVTATADAVEQGATAPVAIQPRIARELPDRPATVSDALPLSPGVVREPGGGLIISASAEHRSALIVNSADVTDPATGQFGLTVPIDSVQALNVYQAPYLAEYGRFTAGPGGRGNPRGGAHMK